MGDDNYIFGFALWAEVVESYQLIVNLQTEYLTELLLLVDTFLLVTLVQNRLQDYAKKIISTWIVTPSNPKPSKCAAALSMHLQ